MNGSEIPGERSDTLQLDSVSYQMNGRRLMCEATNSVGTTRLDYTLQVECELLLTVSTCGIVLQYLFPFKIYRFSCIE